MEEVPETRKPKRVKKEKKVKEDTSNVVPDELIDENKKTIIKENSNAIKALQAFGSNKFMNYLFMDGDTTVSLALVESLGGVLNIHEALTIDNIEDAFRRSVYFSFESTVTIYEGEVTEIKVLRDELEEIREIYLTLAAVKGSKTVRLGRQFRNIIGNINTGDVVYIEPASGLLRRIGRSESRCDEYDLEGDKYVQLNKGTVNTTKNRQSRVSLYDFDFSLSGHNSPISAFTRKSVDGIIRQYVKLKAVKFDSSNLVINRAHLLDKRSLSVLSRCAAEYPWVKILFIGNLNEVSFPLGNFLIVKVKNENIFDILKNRHPKFEKFLEAAEKYVGKVPLEKIEDAIYAAETVSEFVCLMELK
ncbi:RuvB-like protein 1 [Pancytospora epiphaga]|nr:RuvB-like protein 1 [Pancytospora epiphaga]